MNQLTSSYSYRCISNHITLALTQSIPLSKVKSVSIFIPLHNIDMSGVLPTTVQLDLDLYATVLHIARYLYVCMQIFACIVRFGRVNSTDGGSSVTIVFPVKLCCTNWCTLIRLSVCFDCFEGFVFVLLELIWVSVASKMECCFYITTICWQAIFHFFFPVKHKAYIIIFIFDVLK